MRMDQRQCSAVFLGVVVFTVQLGQSFLEYLASDLVLGAGIETQTFVGDIGHEVGATRTDGADLEDGTLAD